MEEQSILKLILTVREIVVFGDISTTVVNSHDQLVRILSKH